MSTTALFPYHLSLPDNSVRYLCETWWTCRSTPQHTWRSRSDCLLATEEVISVIPKYHQDSLDIIVTPATAWKGSVPTWFGVPCSIGRVRMWLPEQDNPGTYRDFALLVLLPKADLPDTPPYIFLGAQFLWEYQVHLELENSSPFRGELIIP